MTFMLTLLYVEHVINNAVGALFQTYSFLHLWALANCHCRLVAKRDVTSSAYKGLSSLRHLHLTTVIENCSWSQGLFILKPVPALVYHSPPPVGKKNPDRERTWKVTTSCFDVGFHHSILTKYLIENMLFETPYMSDGNTFLANCANRSRQIKCC